MLAHDYEGNGFSLIRTINTTVPYRPRRLSTTYAERDYHFLVASRRQGGWRFVRVGKLIHVLAILDRHWLVVAQPSRCNVTKSRRGTEIEPYPLLP